MKKTVLAKISVVVLSCALLIAGIIGISVSATENNASAEFEIATLNYGADVKIAFALDINGADADDVQLNIYKSSDLSGDYTVSEFSGSYYSEVYPVYYSAGISAKDIADYIYAVPVLKSSGEAIGNVCRYSVAQYCYSVLTDSASAEDLKALASDLLEYGASAQNRLINIGNIEAETLISDYRYAYTNDLTVTLDGHGSGLYAPEAKVIPSYSGEKALSSWRIVYDSGNVAIVSENDAKNGITLSEAGAVEFVPEFKVVYDFEDGNIAGSGMENYDLVGSSLSKIENGSSYDGTRVNYNVINDAAGTDNNDNKVLKVDVITTDGGSNAGTKIHSAGAGYTLDGTDAILEMKVKIESTATSGTIAYLYFADEASKGWAFYLSFDLQANGTVKVTQTQAKNSAGETEYVYTTLGTFKSGEWVHLMIKINTSTVLEENTMELLVSNENGEMVSQGAFNCYYNGANIIKDSPMTYAQFDYYRKIDTTFYFDDISYTNYRK